MPDFLRFLLPLQRTAAHLLAVALRAVGLVGLLVGALAVTPHATAAPDTRAALESDIRLWLARHQGVDAQRVQVTPLDARLRVPACPEGWAISLPFNNLQSVRARCENLDPPRQYIVRVNIEAVTQEVATQRQLPAGHVLQADDLMLRPVLAGQAPVFTDIQALVGRALRIDVPRQVTLLPEDLSNTVTLYRLTRSVFSGDRLRPTDVLAQQVDASMAPEGFWSDAWPKTPVIGRALPTGHVLRASDWASMVPAVVALTNIPRGTILTPQMLQVTTLPAPSNGVPYMASVDPLTASETTRPIARGEPIGKLDVRPAVLVKRGSKVMISVGKGRGFQISTQVEALEDGRLGDQIRLLNRQSGRTISGVVTGPNEAEAL